MLSLAAGTKKEKKTGAQKDWAMALAQCLTHRFSEGLCKVGVLVPLHIWALVGPHTSRGR